MLPVMSCNVAIVLTLAFLGYKLCTMEQSQSAPAPAPSTGGGSSSGRSNKGNPYQSKNDYELVIQATKNLEYELQTKFHRPESGLMEKIKGVEGEGFLSRNTIRLMKRLVKLRNEIVHNKHKNRLDPKEKQEFIQGFRLVKNELENYLKKQEQEQQWRGSRSSTVSEDSPCTLM
ncbi:hypothetical protein ACA910_014141 [Epithemia clementina (nom. ined.)]